MGVVGVYTVENGTTQKGVAMSDLDKFSYHEALDRTSVMLDNLEDHVNSHPVVQHHKGLKNLVEEAGVAMAKLYQEIARISDEVHPK